LVARLRIGRCGPANLYLVNADRAGHRRSRLAAPGVMATSGWSETAYRALTTRTTPIIGAGAFPKLDNGFRF